MKDYILIFAIAFLLLVWTNLYARRTKEKKRVQKETKKVLIERLKGKAESVVREGQKVTVMKNIGVLPRAFRSFQRSVYPYYQKERRRGKERRKSRVLVGITFKHIDRRQADSTQYVGSERRSGMDSREKTWDRRKPIVTYDR